MLIKNEILNLIMTATIAAILTTSVLAFALPNQVFAQTGGHGGWLVGHSGLLSQTNVKVLGHVPHVGQILAGHLGDVCLSCWEQALAGHQGSHP
jgi:hypothetical protein